MDAADLSKVHEALVEALAKNRALTAARAAADALEEERKKQASTCVVCAEAESRVALAPCGHMCLCPTDAAQLHAKGGDPKREARNSSKTLGPLFRASKLETHPVSSFKARNASRF